MCSSQSGVIQTNCAQYLKEIKQSLPELPRRSYNNLTKILTSWDNALPEDSISGSKLNPPLKESKSSVNTGAFLSRRLIPLGAIQPQDISIPQHVGDILRQNHHDLLRQSLRHGFDVLSPSDHYDFTCNCNCP